MSPEAKTFLAEIRNRSEWKEVLSEIKGKPLQAFRPLRSPDDRVEDQTSNWIYESGRVKERDRVIKLLTTGE